MGGAAAAAIPGAQPFIPVAAGLGSAIGGQIDSSAQSVRSKRVGVPIQSPMTEQLMAEADAKRRNLGAGVGFAPGRRMVGEQLATTQEAIGRYGGGDTAGTVQGLIRAQRIAGLQTNQLSAALGQREQFFTSMLSDLTNRIEQRKFDIAMYEKLANKAQSVQSQKDSTQNLFGAMTSSSFEDILKKMLEEKDEDEIGTGDTSTSSANDATMQMPGFGRGGGDIGGSATRATGGDANVGGFQMPNFFQGGGQYGR